MELEKHRSYLEHNETLERDLIAVENSSMNTKSFDLLFIPSAEAPHPIATVFVKFGTRREYGGLGTGKIFVSQECASFTEFSSEIDRMIRELEGLRLKARTKFEGEASTRR